MLMQVWNQIWPLLIALSVIGFFFYKGRGRVRSGDFTDPATAQQGAELEADDAGLHRTAGTTDGVAWTVEVLRLASEVDDGVTVRRSTSVNFTRWTAPGCVPAGGRMLIMNLPKGQASGFVVEEPAQGIIGQLKRHTATLALQVYVRQRFGAARADAAFDPNRRLPPDATGDDSHFAAGFAVWCEGPDLPLRLTAPVRDWLVQHHDSGVAALWDGQGLTLHWITPTVTTDALQDRAREGAALVNLLRP